MFKSDQFISKENLLEWSQESGLELKVQKSRKGEVFLEHRQRCRYFYFVDKGFIRLYYLDLGGQEITHWFSAENMMITSPFSFFRDETNILNFESLEDSEFILITRDQLNLLSDRIASANKAFQSLFVEFAMRLSRRIMSIHTESAEYRYLKLLEEHPLIFQKAKLAHIASYLGITQQSLSRIRRNLIH